MKNKQLFLISCCFIFLSGCWDQKLLKDTKLVNGVSIDMDNDHNLLVTSAIKTNSLESSGSNQTQPTNQIISAKAKTISEIRIDVNHKASGEYSINKTRVFVFGDSFANQDIYPILDIFYRNPRSSLGAKIILSKGRAEEILRMEEVGETLISEEILNLITNAESQTIVPEENIQSICPIMFDPGEDIALPLIEKKEKEKMVNIAGIGLFNGTKYTGHSLLKDEATMFLLLHNKMGKDARFAVDINPSKNEQSKQVTGILIQKNKSKMTIHISKKNNITVDFDVKMKAEVLEYPSANSNVKNKLNKELSKKLTEKAKEVVHTLQLANSDALGIGRELASFHPKVWKKLDWEKVYPNIQIKPKVKVEIVETGILK